MRADVFTGVLSAGHGSPNSNSLNQPHRRRFAKEGPSESVPLVAVICDLRVPFRIYGPTLTERRYIQKKIAPGWRDFLW